MATLDDIARTLGISKGTVSKALNGADDVSDSMRKAVVEKAVELGYTRLRRNQRAPELAVFIINMDYHRPEDFGYDILVGFRQMAEPAGFRVHIIDLTHQLEESVHYDQYMLQHNYQGGLFLGLSLDDPWQTDFKTCKTPTVLYDNQIQGNPKVTYVGADNSEGLRLAVQHLSSLGHRKIGYLSSALGAYVYQRRYSAFFQAMEESGLSCGPDYARDSYFNAVCLQEHLPALLDLGCTAIICSHDMLAASVLAYCQMKGIRIPEELSVIGFDDIPLCRATTPPLSTIQQNRTELGKSCYCALSSQMEGVPLSTFLLHTELILRDSCQKLSS